MTTTKAAAPKNVAAPVGLRVSERLLADYRALQNRLANPHLDALGRDRTAEKLESRIRKATELYPWTPAEIYRWTYAWLHVLAFGAEAKVKKCYHFYGGRRPERVDWVLQYPDIAGR